MSAVPDRSEIGPYLGGHWATPRGPSAKSVSPEHLRVRAISPKALMSAVPDRSEIGPYLGCLRGDLGGFYNFGLPVKRLKPRQRWRRSHGEEEGYPRLRRSLESIAHRMTRITIEPQELTLARLSRNDSIGSVVLAASSSARALLFARSGSQPWAFHRPAPRSRLVFQKNPQRHPFPPN